MRRRMNQKKKIAGAFFLLTALASIALSAEPATNLPPGVAPAMSRVEIEAGLKFHDRALYIKQGWIRDPYITLGPDDFYYLTGTTPNPGDPREQSDPYNTGLGKTSIVGSAVRVWRSKDLVDWEYIRSEERRVGKECRSRWSP